MESFEQQAGNNKITEDDHQYRHDDNDHSKQGGWITFPFIIGNLTAVSVAAGGWGANFIVFLITKFNVGSITATKINNVGFGFVNLFPVAGAIIADSFSGNFLVVAISSLLAFLGMCMLTLIATTSSLKPSPCNNISSTTSTHCQTPTNLQYLFLYAATGLATIGFGGSRFTVATMGADQFERNPKHQATFFNWFFVFFYVGNAIGFVPVVYVEDNVGWGLGFGICSLSALAGLVVFLLGTRFYRSVKPSGSPFASVARVVVAAFRKRNVAVVEGSDNYYCGGGGGVAKLPSKSFRFLNRAALKTEINSQANGSSDDPKKSWILCTVEEVEDLKEVMKILPLWSSSILLSITIAILNSFTTVQALTMDRSLGSVKVSAGTFLVFSLISTAVSIFLIDNILLPLWARARGGRPITPLQRIGVGHAINVAAMVGSALVEARRLEKAGGGVHIPAGSVVPMSAFWLILGLAVAGVGEGFQFPGQVSLYYQEFPRSLKSTSTAMISLLIGLGYYLSAAFTDFIDRTTGWLPDNINEGRLDKVYWLCAIIGTANFGYYLVCAWLYKYKHDPNADD